MVLHLSVTRKRKMLNLSKKSRKLYFLSPNSTLFSGPQNKIYKHKNEMGGEEAGYCFPDPKT